MDFFPSFVLYYFTGQGLVRFSRQFVLTFTTSDTNIADGEHEEEQCAKWNLKWSGPAC